MRRVLALALLALALPIGASASGILLANKFGAYTITGSGGVGSVLDVGVSLPNQPSQLTSFNYGSLSLTGPLGHVTYQTGALTSGTIAAGGTFAGGGSFDVTGVGKWAVNLTGASNCGHGCSIFVGSFSGPLTWVDDGKITSGVLKGDTEYTLSGAVSGTLYDGRTVTGTTVQNLFTSNHWTGNNGNGEVLLGTSALGTPEPETLGLLATGLVGIAGIVRRKRTRL